MLMAVCNSSEPRQLGWSIHSGMVKTAQGEQEGVEDAVLEEVEKVESEAD
jgi:hypothetical protein